MNHTFPGGTLLFVLTASASLGCQSLEDGAKDEFVSKFSCPKSGIELRTRPEIDAYTLIFGARSAPPAEVARDPARLAIWQKKQDDSHASWNASETVFELRGCGHEVLYTCTRSNTGRHSGSVMCSEQAYPPGVTHWSPVSEPAVPKPVVPKVAYQDSPEVKRVERSLSGGAFHGCMNKGLASDPKMTGSAEVVVEIDTAGKPGPAKVTGSLSSSVKQCLQSQVAGAHFPEPKDGPETITIPVTLVAR